MKTEIPSVILTERLKLRHQSDEIRASLKRQGLPLTFANFRRARLDLLRAKIKSEADVDECHRLALANEGGRFYCLITTPAHFFFPKVVIGMTNADFSKVWHCYKGSSFNLAERHWKTHIAPKLAI